MAKGSALHAESVFSLVRDWQAATLISVVESWNVAFVSRDHIVFEVESVTANLQLVNGVQ